MVGPLDDDETWAEDAAWIRVEDPSAAGAARRSAAELAADLAFPEVRAAELAIVVTEIATNLVKHAEQASLLLRVVRARDAAGIQVVAVDGGPGLRDVATASVDGVSSTGTLGLGMGAISRLSSTWDVHSVPGRGTVLTASLWAGAAPAPPRGGAGEAAGLTRPITGEEACGDAVAVRRAGGASILLVVDGLGHGPLAELAAGEAVRVFRASSATAPGALLAEIHREVQHTRGAAVAVAALDRAAGTLRYAGLGNIAGTVVSDGRRSGLVSLPGIAGHNARSLRETEHPLPPDAVVVMHSDGVRERWDLDDYPGLLVHGPLVVAATVLRDAGGRRDDASVLVALPPRPEVDA